MITAKQVIHGTMQSLMCDHCGAEATCIGRYDVMTEDEPACDECCGHGCEDGHCTQLYDVDGGVEPEARQRVADYLNRVVHP